MSDPRQRKLDTVRKLLDRAVHPNTPPAEAEQCQARAYELMAKYQIDDAMLADGRLDATDVEQRWIAVEAPYAKEKVLLLDAIALCLGGHVLSRPRKWRYGKGVESYIDEAGDRQYRRTVVFQYGHGVDAKIIGFPNDLDRIEMLHTTLLLHAVNDMQHARPDNPHEDLGAFRASFLIGFAGRIRTRLESKRQQAAAEADDTPDGRGASLVLADRSALVQQAYEAIAQGAHKSKPSTYSGSGRGHGARSAATAALQTQEMTAPAAKQVRA